MYRAKALTWSSCVGAIRCSFKGSEWCYGIVVDLQYCISFRCTAQWFRHICICVCILCKWGFPAGSDCKESTCNAGDLGSILGSGRSPGGGHGNPLQYSCLENPMDRGAWQATVCGVVKSWTWLTNTHTNTHTYSLSDSSWRILNVVPYLVQ